MIILKVTINVLSATSNPLSREVPNHCYGDNKCYSAVTYLLKYLLNKTILLNQPQSKIGQVSCANSWHKIKRYYNKRCNYAALLGRNSPL